MERFVNRDKEMLLIDDAVTTLLERQHLLRTPIVEFCGVEGIGKTTLLRKVEEKCRDKHLPCVWGDIQQGSSVSLKFIQSAKELLQSGKAAVIILDSLESANEEQLREIATELHDLTEMSNLFVVLASRSVQIFENIRFMARKMTVCPLKSFDRESCLSYLDYVADIITPEARKTIFEWTRGYPLAMNVMINAVLEKNLDPLKDLDQKQLLSIITEKVINQSLFSHLAETQWPRFYTLLSLLSVPRRFNLVIMQDLIEQFAADFKLESSLAYITLPAAINRDVNVLNWDMAQAGYCIEAPVRNLFLLKLSIEMPERYVAINKFLAQKHESFIKDVSRSDGVRYLREYFYHLANSGEVAYFRPIFTHSIERLDQSSLEYLLQFYEEFMQDEELQDVFGENAGFVLSLIRKSFAKVYGRLVAEGTGHDRFRYLKEFFIQTAHNPGIADFSLIFEEGMRHIIEHESSDVAVRLYREFQQDAELKILLGMGFERVSALLFDEE